MAIESRLQKTFINAKVNLFFTLLALIIAFFSRKIFLDKLGINFLGLIATVQSFLEGLNLAELGIGIAISYALYKPLANNDKKSISEIVSVLGYLYHRIGIFVASIGVLISLFFPFIFHGREISLLVVYVAFYTYLLSALLSYFVNYKITLLSADQKNYEVVKYLKSSNIIQLLCQMGVAYYSSNPYFYIFISLVFNIIYAIILNWRIHRLYPDLDSSAAKGKKIWHQYPHIFKLTKQLFIHKIAGFAQGQLSPLLIFAFVSLRDVTLYGNYIALTSKLFLLLESVMGSTYASVGNLIAENDKSKMLCVFQELLALRFFLTGYICFCCCFVFDFFISVWIGPQYILSKLILYLILADFFITGTRGTVEQFISGFGIFSDVFFASAETIIFVTVACIFGYYYGMAGILLGGLVSKLLIVCLWKPYFLFNRGFNSTVQYYWKIYLKSLGILVVTFIFGKVFSDYFLPSNNVGWLYIFICIVALSVIYCILAGGLMFMFLPGFRLLLMRGKFIIVGILKKD